MLTVDIPHGGSGDGITTWMARGTGCLIASDLATQHARKCDNKNMLIGTMFHEYMRLWRGGLVEASERVWFVDTQCGTPPLEEWQDEAYRLFDHYSQNEEIDKFGKVIATEQRLSGPAVEQALGISPYAATIDLLAGTEDACTLVDYKTARASGDTYYTSGAGRYQLVAYYLAARAAGYAVERVVIEQVTKTKTPKVNTYTMEMPSLVEQKTLQVFLQGAKNRYQNAERTVWLTSCGPCSWHRNGLCLPQER